MKTAITAAFIALALIIATSALAAGNRASESAMPDAASSASQMSEGLVKRVDRSGGKVTIAHGPLANVGMPAMTMAFRVKDPTWLDQLKEGDRIRFIADNVQGSLTVVQFNKPK